ncbi:unnamed protein product, partial [Rotaria sp. Silwood1]
ECHFLVNLE